MDDKQALTLVQGRLVKTSGSLKDIAKQAQTRPVLMLDRSGSMSSTTSDTGYGGQRKIDALRELVIKLRADADFDQMCFDSLAEWTEEIGEPRGGTALHLALDLAAEKVKSRRFVLITDGAPDYEDRALESARKLPAPLDIFYVGPDTGYEAEHCKAFLKKLAEATKGQFGAADLSQKELENKVRLALNPGSPDDIAKGPIAL